MTSARQHGNEKTRERLGFGAKAAVGVGALIVVSIALVAFEHYAQSRERIEVDFMLFAGALFFAYRLPGDVRRGRTALGTPIASVDYVRDADPSGFWVLLVIKAAFGAACVVALLGELLGFWKIT